MQESLGIVSPSVERGHPEYLARYQPNIVPGVPGACVPLHGGVSWFPPSMLWRVLWSEGFVGTFDCEDSEKRCLG